MKVLCGALLHAEKSARLAELVEDILLFHILRGCLRAWQLCDDLTRVRVDNEVDQLREPVNGFLVVRGLLEDVLGQIREPPPRRRPIKVVDQPRHDIKGVRAVACGLPNRLNHLTRGDASQVIDVGWIAQ